MTGLIHNFFYFSSLGFFYPGYFALGKVEDKVPKVLLRCSAA